MAKVKFNKSFMLDILDSDNLIENKIIESTRWSIIHEIIFRHEDKYYKTYYSVGATETQYESPWQYEDEVACEEVHKVPKMIEVWEVVED